MRRKLLLISICLSAALANRQATCADREWNVFQPGNGACYVRFPANPEYQTQMVDAVATHIYMSRDTTRTPPFVYTVGFGDYPREKFADKDAPKKILDTDRDSFIRAVNGKLVSEKPVTKETYSGRMIIVSAEEGHASYALCEFLIGHRIFQISVCVPANMLDDPDVAKFFDSFQLPKQ